MLRTFSLLAVVLLTTSFPAFAADTDSATTTAAVTPTKVEATASATKPATPELPASADLRPQMEKWGLVPRHQGRRNTCSVFATTGIIEYAVSKHNDRGTRL